MDLPPDKARILRSYDDDKKWELIQDQVCLIPITFDANIMLINIHTLINIAHFHTHICYRKLSSINI